MLEWGRALWEAGAQIDVVPVTADLTGYDVVAAPLLHLVVGDLPQRLEAVTARGGTVVTGYLSGRVDEDDRRFLGDVPGPLADLVGVRVTETDAAEPEVGNPIRFVGGNDGGAGAGDVDGDVAFEVPGRMIFEVLEPAEGTDVVARYGADFYAGVPAVTRRRVAVGGEGAGGAEGAEGHAWHLGTQLDQPGLAHVMRRVLARHDLVGPYADVPGLELATRVAPSGGQVDVLMHHGTEAVTVALHAGGTDLLTGLRLEAGAELRLEPTDVVVLQR